MSKQNKRKKTIHIGGMTCTSCEILIGDELQEMEGVNKAKVSCKTNTAEIYYTDDEPDHDDVISIITKLGYQAGLEPFEKEKKVKATSKQWLYAFLVLFGLYIVYKYLKWIGVMRLLEIDTSEISFGVAILVGIVASMSTCLAVVGAVVMSFAAKYQTRGTAFERNVQPHLLFHAGRLITFFALGGLLGIVGSIFSFSTSAIVWVTIILSVILFWLGLNILGFVPSLTRVGIRMPGNISRHWNKLKTSEHALAPMILGGITFFLPCGFTQSMQLFAVSSGSFWTGAFTMFLFALGTLPILLAVGISTSRAKSKKRVVFQLVVGILIVLFSFYTFSSALAIMGVSTPTNKSDKTEVSESIDGVQVVRMDIGYYGFEPATIKLKKDVPVKWIIDGEGSNGCTNKIIVPNLGISKKIGKGENIVEFTPTEVGNINFSCWMGMVRGNFIVE